MREDDMAPASRAEGRGRSFRKGDGTVAGILCGRIIHKGPPGLLMCAPGTPSALLMAFALLTGVSTTLAGVHCEKPCKAETAACIRDRCTGVAGTARHTCIETCRAIGGCAAIRTLAYVWNQCRSDTLGFTIRRELRIRRGNCAPKTIMTLESDQPAPDPGRSCELYGASGAGWAAVLIGGFQRLAVSPDGSG